MLHNYEEAIEYLQQKGFKKVVIGGGTEIYNLFLNNDLVTDLYFNYVPVIVGDGGILGTEDGLLSNFKLMEYNLLEENILQTHLTKVYE